MKKLVLLMVLIGCIQQARAVDIYPFDTPKQEQQFHHILRELRCLVCQNQDLVDSNAGLAKDLRDVVYQLLQEGHSIEAIRRYLTERYGEYILFKPAVNQLTGALWLGPWLLLAVGVWIFMRATRYE
jgi:cytochrome c-type biogenesis protein CcmH